MTPLSTLLMRKLGFTDAETNEIHEAAVALRRPRVLVRLPAIVAMTARAELRRWLEGTEADPSVPPSRAASSTMNSKASEGSEG